MRSWSFLKHIWNADIHLQWFLEDIFIPSQKTFESYLYVSFFPVPYFLMLLGKIQQWKCLLTISPSHGTLLPEQAKKWWQKWAMHFLVHQLGQGKSCRCNHVNKPDVLAIWALWRWNSVFLIIQPGVSPAAAVFKGTISRISAHHSWVRVWSALERSHSLCSNLGNCHFIQAGIR